MIIYEKAILIPQVGEVFYYNNKKLQCVKNTEVSCKNCAFNKVKRCENIVRCVGSDRPDNTYVNFIKIQ